MEIGTKNLGKLTLMRDICIATALIFLSAALLVPIDGILPSKDLDLSWPYTLADATNRHIPFGRDMVFTFGPLSSIYTRFFLPDQRVMFAALKTVLVAAFCLATFASSRRSMRWVSLAIPLLIANIFLPDAFFLVAPWVIVPLSTASWRNPRWHEAGLIALSVVLGPLLLVKGTLALPLTISLGAAALVISRRSWLGALALPCAALASIVVAWLAAGQHFLNLIYYIQRESYVAGGYTEAMSIPGEANEVLVYLAGATVLLISQTFLRRSASVMAITSAAVLFVAFKAGFVRHDGHAMIAASTLLLLGFLLFLYRGNLAAGVGFAASLAAWLFIGSHYWAVDPVSDIERMTTALSDEFRAIRVAAADPDAFRRDFEATRDGIAAAAALPPTTGTVDLYPNSQALLLASKRDYYPRPVMQSYSAYTPELAFLNAEHLNGPHAPKTVFIDIMPIDGRYPALEDGPSWPALLGQYRFRSFAQDYAVIDRVEGAATATIDHPFSSGSYAFGEPVAIPLDVPFVWAKMQFHPTLLGRIRSALFKLPLLHMDISTADGTKQTFRIVAGMASAGFLLSPTVTTAHDFVALRSTATDALSEHRVTSITLRQDDGSHLWGGHFDLQLAALHIPPDPRIDDMALGHLESGPPADELPASGDCTIDMVGNVTPDDDPFWIKGKTTAVTGWAFISAAKGDDGGNLRIAVTPSGGATVYATAERQPRPDVDAFFHLTHATHAGFTAQVNLSAIKGPATLRVVQDSSSGPAVCGKPVQFIR